MSARASASAASYRRATTLSVMHIPTPASSDQATLDQLARLTRELQQLQADLAAAQPATVPWWARPWGDAVALTRTGD